MSFTAYFDASGTPSDSVLTMAGYVSDERKWGKFEQAWQTILAGEGVSQFHMNECVGSHGEYKGWTPERRNRFINDLSECALKYTNKRFSASVVIADFNRADAEFEIHERLGYPYTLCGVSCIGHVLSWAHNRRVTEQVNYFFEDGDKHKGDFERACRERFGRKPITPIFQKKKDALAFQAADLAAWKTRHPIRAAEGDRPYTQEQVDTLLLHTKRYLTGRNRHAGGVFNYESFIHICNGANLPRR
jgi:hypothetical protein